MPVGQMPVSQTPVGRMPVSQIPVGQTFICLLSFGQMIFYQKTLQKYFIALKTNNKGKRDSKPTKSLIMAPRLSALRHSA
jgi:hypothetical protein